MTGLKRYCDTHQLVPPHEFIANMQDYATGNSFISRDLKELYQQWLDEIATDAQQLC